MVVGTLGTFLQRPGTQKVVLALALVALIGIISYILYRVAATSLKAVELTHGGTIRADAEPVRIQAKQIPDLENGSEYGYSVWLYVERFQPTDKPRVVLQHGGISLSMDANKNALNFELGSGVVSHDYVPLNRWVHVVCVYRDGSVTFFVDGEVAAVYRFTSDTLPEDPAGDLVLGGGSGRWTNWQGYIGATTFLNHYPSLANVKKMYASGPGGKGGVLNLVGMGNYAVRSPVYRV
jgi:hypothetical protein